MLHIVASHAVGRDVQQTCHGGVAHDLMPDGLSEPVELEDAVILLNEVSTLGQIKILDYLFTHKPKLHGLITRHAMFERVLHPCHHPKAITLGYEFNWNDFSVGVKQKGVPRKHKRAMPQPGGSM